MIYPKHDDKSRELAMDILFHIVEDDPSRTTIFIKEHVEVIGKT